jgi:simple sugar transport system ATP-binding protein
VTVLVEAAAVTKRFGPNVALDNVDLQITKGRTHALTGRNGAGKSTLVSVLTGLLAPDSGTLALGGEPAPALSDRDTWHQRVACVYQHSTIIPDLTVAENLFLHRQNLDGRVIRWSRLRSVARDILDTWSVPVAVDTAARDLSVEHRQLVEIARSLSRGARFIILDEPTAQLDGVAIKRLFERIHDLQAQGVTFLYISHHLDEAYEICQDITVLRDAKLVVSAAVSDLPKPELIAAMTGEATTLQEPVRRERTVAADSTVALDVAGLSRGNEFHDVVLKVAAGEIVGLAGGGASGKIEVAETIVGLRRPSHGEVRVAGRVARPGSVRAGLRSGIGFIPHDRRHEGLVLQMSVADNATLTVPERLGPVGLLSRRVRARMARQAISDLDIKTEGPDQEVASLSGGNQQKVVFARALASDPSVLVLITPTAGVDVRSKATLLEVVDRIAANGTGVLMVSDELDDLRICDRVVVMVQGRISAEFRDGWSDNDLVAAMEGLS